MDEFFGFVLVLGLAIVAFYVGAGCEGIEAAGCYKSFAASHTTADSLTVTPEDGGCKYYLRHARGEEK